MTAALGAVPAEVDCRRLELLTVVNDRARCEKSMSALLDRAARRWLGRTGQGELAPGRGWHTIDRGEQFGGADSPIRLIEAAAAGTVLRTGNLATDLAATLMLHSRCPALADSIQLPDRITPPSSLRITIYGLDGDDLALAESLVDVLTRGDALTILDRITQAITVHAGPDSTDPRGCGCAAVTDLRAG
ncbi:hypothetical protein ACFVMC_12495 [Nocardia sp. NPDC127579]|uniref:hypothetical protein n=1 Tax=Nocardia sp. NPDC127579 TaxID=3345402 RepID=UPI00363D8416